MLSVRFLKLHRSANTYIPDFTKNWFAIDNEINSVLVNNRYQSRQEIMNWYNDCHFFNPTFENCEYNENDEKLKIIKAARSVKDKRRKNSTATW